MLNYSVDQEQVWGRCSLQLKLEFLRLQRWTIGFDPYKEKSTTTQLWVCFIRLPWELWNAQILSNIARFIGVPLRIECLTVDGDFGNYARILIDVDLAKPL